MKNGSIEEKYGCDIMLSENKENANMCVDDSYNDGKEYLYVCVRLCECVCVYRKNEFFDLEGSCFFLSIFL